MKRWGGVLAALACGPLAAETVPPPGAVDARVREVEYRADEVYRVRGEVGYQLHLELEPGEHFEGLGAGDLGGIELVAQGRHLFLKPKAAPLATNLTVLTDRRIYHFEYRVAEAGAFESARERMYSLRFRYPAATEAPVQAAPAAAPRVRNERYAFCGHRTLRPLRVFDDGVQTFFEFGARAELPAIYVRGADGAESVVNFTVEGAGIRVHRVAERFVLRRGRLTACVWNRGFAGGGERLEAGTVEAGVVRETRGNAP